MHRGYLRVISDDDMAFILHTLVMMKRKCWIGASVCRSKHRVNGNKIWADRGGERRATVS